MDYIAAFGGFTASGISPPKLRNLPLTEYFLKKTSRESTTHLQQPVSSFAGLGRVFTIRICSITKIIIMETTWIVAFLFDIMTFKILLIHS